MKFSDSSSVVIQKLMAPVILRATTTRFRKSVGMNAISSTSTKVFFPPPPPLAPSEGEKKKKR